MQIPADADECAWHETGAPRELTNQSGLRTVHSKCTRTLCPFCETDAQRPASVTALMPIGLYCAAFLALAAAAAAQPAPAGQSPARPLNPTQEIAKEEPEGPSIDAGPAKLRVGGYVGLHAIYRSTNSGGGPGTNFATIPYADIVQGNVSELRLSAQASRLSLRVDADYPEGPRFHRLSGYFEMDFAGATPGTVAVTASGVGFRLRLAFAEVQYGKAWFLAAGSVPRSPRRR